MNRYLEHMHTKSPHERRQHAMRVAGVLTALVFVGWITSFGIASVAGGGGQPNPDQTAAAAQANPYTQNQLIVATSSDY